MENNGILTPIKAIRAHCLDCMCGQATEVRLCPITDCSLYPYRMGHNPKRAGLGENHRLELVNLPRPLLNQQPTPPMITVKFREVG